MTYEELGRQIKEKYPQYQSLGDAEVGQKIVEKYPQYQDLIDQPSLAQKINLNIPGLAGGILGGTIGAMAGPVTGIAGAAAGAAGGETLAGGIRDITQQGLPRMQQASRIGGEALTSGLGEAAGLGVAAGLSTLGKTTGRGMEWLGKRLVKTGTPATGRMYEEGIERGFDVYEELTKRNLLSQDRSAALRQIQKELASQENVIQQAVKASKRTVVAGRKEIERIVKPFIKTALEEADEKATKKFLNQFIKRQGEKINAEQALKLKRTMDRLKIGGKLTSVKQARNAVLDFLRTTLKEKVPATKTALREQEILLNLKPILKRIRGMEGVKGIPDINLYRPIQGLTRTATFGKASQLGQTLQRGAAQMGQGVSPAVQSALRLFGQGIPRLGRD